MSRRPTSAAVMQQRAQSRQSVDYYPTPPWATRALLQHVQLAAPLTVLEPAAGGGDMERPLAETGATVTAADLHDPAGLGYRRVDFLASDAYRDRSYDWVITNPPFLLAAQFAARALSVACRGVALLARVALLEGQQRYDRLWSQHQLTDVLVFTERVAMVEGRLDERATSAVCYAWYIWSPTADHQTPRLRWIPPGTRRALTRADDYPSDQTTMQLDT